MRNRSTTAIVILVTVAPAGIALAEPRNATPTLRQRPRVVGQRPPALTPFAENDPIPKLSLVPHSRQETPSQAAESCLYHLSKGYYVPGIVEPDSIIGGEAQGYQLAWWLLGPERPSLTDFKERWEGTVAIKGVQLESIDDKRFFVEFQRVERCEDHWAVSFYHGVLTTVKTPEGWRVQDLHVEPDNLVGTNIARHQGWQHDEDYVTKWAISPKEELQPWVVLSRQCNAWYLSSEINPSMRETLGMSLPRVSRCSLSC